MFEIAEELKKLPDQPGVYIMHDRQAMMRGSKKRRW